MDDTEFLKVDTARALDVMIARARDALTEFETAVRTAECESERGTSSEAAEAEKKVDVAREKLLAYLSRPILVSGVKL